MASITRAMHKPPDAPRITDRRGSLKVWIPSLSRHRAATALRCAKRLRRACWSQQQMPCAKSCAVIARRSSASAADADMPDLWRPALADFVQAAAVILDIYPDRIQRLPGLRLAESALQAPFSGAGDQDAYPESRSGQPC
jgi:hypothetical protein